MTYRDLSDERRAPLTDEELRAAAVHGSISHDASSERQNLWGQYAARASAELLAARRRIAELESRSEKRRIRMVAAEEDIAEVRGMLSPQGYPRRISDGMEIGGSVAPAVEWLLARIAELEAAQRPPLGIEAALEYAWDDGNASGLDGWTGPGRGAGEVDNQAIYNRDRAIRTALERLGETPRPPLGYVVGRQSVDGWTFNRFYGGPADHVGAAQDLVGQVEEDGPAAGWQLLEVREVTE